MNRLLIAFLVALAVAGPPRSGEAWPSSMGASLVASPWNGADREALQISGIAAHAGLLPHVPLMVSIEGTEIDISFNVLSPDMMYAQVITHFRIIVELPGPPDPFYHVTASAYAGGSAQRILFDRLETWLPLPIPEDVLLLNVEPVCCATCSLVWSRMTPKEGHAERYYVETSMGSVPDPSGNVCHPLWPGYPFGSIVLADTTTVTEPTSLLLALSGLAGAAGLALARWRVASLSA